MTLRGPLDCSWHFCIFHIYWLRTVHYTDSHPCLIVILLDPVFNLLVSSFSSLERTIKCFMDLVFHGHPVLNHAFKGEHFALASFSCPGHTSQWAVVAALDFTKRICIFFISMDYNPTNHSRLSLCWNKYFLDILYYIGIISCMERWYFYNCQVFI